MVDFAVNASGSGCERLSRANCRRWVWIVADEHSWCIKRISQVGTSDVYRGPATDAQVAGLYVEDAEGTNGYKSAQKTKAIEPHGAPGLEHPSETAALAGLPGLPGLPASPISRCFARATRAAPIRVRTLSITTTTTTAPRIAPIIAPIIAPMC